MTTTQKRRSWRHLAKRTFLLLMLYALSIGPFLWFESRGYMEGAPPWLLDCIQPFYRPLFWFVDGVPAVTGAFHWYMDVWRV
jgi:hypothetical protein